MFDPTLLELSRLPTIAWLRGVTFAKQFLSLECRRRIRSCMFALLAGKGLPPMRYKQLCLVVITLRADIIFAVLAMGSLC